MKQAIAILTILLTLVACDVKVTVNDKNETTMGTHQVIVKPGSAFTSSYKKTIGSKSTYEFKSGDTQIKIENDNLFVNEKDYGKVPKNSDILVEDVKVFISGQEISPLWNQKREPADTANSNHSFHSFMLSMILDVLPCDNN